MTDREYQQYYDIYRRNSILSYYRKVGFGNTVYTVAFNIGDGIIINTTVSAGEDAIEPIFPRYKVSSENPDNILMFSSWDKPITNVRENMIVNAIWENVGTVENMYTDDTFVDTTIVKDIVL